MTVNTAGLDATSSEVAETPHFPALDTLRAVGAICVLTTHVGFHSGSYWRHGIFGSVLARLDVGVALFFVLSGFLLARPYLARARAGGPRPAAGHYFWKRFLRIFPVYAVAVTLGLLLLPANRELGVSDWLVTLALSNTFVDPLPPAGLTQMWSLGVEVSFYVVLPLVMLLATARDRLQPLRALTVMAAGVAVTVWWHLHGVTLTDGLSDGSALQWLPAYLSWFAVGITLALLHVLATTGSRSRAVAAVFRFGRQPGVCWALAAALMLVAATPLGGPTDLAPPSPVESLTKNLLYAAMGGLVLLAGIEAGRDGLFARTFSNPWARHLGFISYSVFCFHMLVLELVARWMDWGLFAGHGLGLWLLTLAISLAISELAYRLVELPAMKLKRLLPLRGVAARAGTATNGTSTT